MLGIFKRLWAAIKAPFPHWRDGENQGSTPRARPRRSQYGSNMAWLHGHGWRYNGSHFGARRRHTVRQVRGPKNGWGRRRGPGF